jgi:pilus assembly protein CpaF
MQEIFQFQQRGTDTQGRVFGDYAFTGIRPRAMEQIQRSGIDPAHILEGHLRGA